MYCMYMCVYVCMYVYVYMYVYCTFTLNFLIARKKWLKTFTNLLHRSFRKIRITNRPIKTQKVHQLMKTKTMVLEKIAETRLIP